MYRPRQLSSFFPVPSPSSLFFLEAAADFLAVFEAVFLLEVVRVFLVVFFFVVAFFVAVFLAVVFFLEAAFLVTGFPMYWTI